MSVNETVRTLLDQAVAQGQSIPSLRQLRAQLGGGSLTTISEAVKAWRLSRLEETGQVPVIDDKAKLELGQMLWDVIQPELQKRIEHIHAMADKRVAIEVAEAKKLRIAAAEVFEEAKAQNIQADAKLAEVSSVLKENASLRAQVEKLAQEKINLESMLKAGQERETRLQTRLEAALQASAAAEASVITLRKMVPFLDPKYVPKR